MQKNIEEFFTLLLHLPFISVHWKPTSSEVHAPLCKSLRTLKADRNKKRLLKVCLSQLCRAEVDVRALSTFPLQEFQGSPRRWWGGPTLWRRLFKKALMKGLGRAPPASLGDSFLAAGLPSDATRAPLQLCCSCALPGQAPRWLGPQRWPADVPSWLDLGPASPLWTCPGLWADPSSHHLCWLCWALREVRPVALLLLALPCSPSPATVAPCQ